MNTLKKKENDMGVYIPNMEKPKDSCWECKAQYNSVCSLKREHIRWDGILDDCPLEVFDVLMEIQKHLIKCKDCKWCEKRGGILWCNIWHDDTNGLNFCSYAERRAK